MQSGKSPILLYLLITVTLAFTLFPIGWLATPLADNEVFYWSVVTPDGQAAYSGHLALHETDALLSVWQGHEPHPNATLQSYAVLRPGCRSETFIVPETCAYLIPVGSTIGLTRSTDVNKLWRGRVFLFWLPLLRR